MERGKVIQNFHNIVDVTNITIIRKLCRFPPSPSHLELDRPCGVLRPRLRRRFWPWLRRRLRFGRWRLYFPPPVNVDGIENPRLILGRRWLYFPPPVNVDGVEHPCLIFGRRRWRRWGRRGRRWGRLRFAVDQWTTPFILGIM